MTQDQVAFTQSLARWVGGGDPTTVVTPDLIPFAMSSDGDTAIIYHYRPSGYAVELWTEADGTRPFPPELAPWLLTPDGKTVVGMGATSLLRSLAFYTDAGGLVLTDFSETLEDAGSIELHAASADGGVVGGGLSDESGQSPFVWSASGLLQLGALPSTAPGTTPEGYVATVSADGTTAAGFARVSDHETRTFRWTAAEGMIDVADCRGSHRECLTEPTPVLVLSDDGKVLASTMPDATDLSAHAFRRAEDGAVLELTPGVLSQVSGMSGDGSVILGNTLQTVTIPLAAFVWDEAHGARELRSALVTAGVDARGWDLDTAAALSKDGHVAIGFGRCGGDRAMYRAVIPE